MELNFLNELMIDLNKTNSKNDKIAVLKEYNKRNGMLLAKWMNHVFNYNFQYYVTSANLLKMSELKKASAEYCDEADIFTILENLNLRVVTGHNAISLVNGYVSRFSQYKDMIYKVIDKDLKCNIDVKTVNKAIPGCVVTFDVALANAYEEKRMDTENENYFISHKLDGLRCIAQVSPGSIRFFSRKGKEFFTLDVLKAELEKANNMSERYVLDGELCIIDENGKDDFHAITKEYKKKNHTIERPRYKVFDVLTPEEFNSQTSKALLSERLPRFHIGSPNIELLDQVKFTDKSFASMQETVVEKGWEGLIIRKDAAYKGKRSYDLMKVKKFFDAEYIVNKVEIGLVPVLHKDGKVVEEEGIKSLLIEHKGYVVNVGSGLSHQQRLDWFKTQTDIVGKTIKVQYFEETTNDNGTISLRFPTLVHVYENGRDA